MDRELGTFDDVISALSYIHYLAWEDCRDEYMNWQALQILENGYTSPSDIPESEKELKQHELVREREKMYILEDRK